MARAHAGSMLSELSFQKKGDNFPPRSVDIQVAINSLAEAEAGERGAIFTRRSVKKTRFRPFSP